MRTHSFASLLLLAACGKGQVTLSGGGVADDTGSADTANTPIDPDLIFLLQGEAVGTSLDVVWFNPGDDLTNANFGGALAHVEVDSTKVELEVGAPDPSLLLEVDPVGAPGLMLAFFIPMLIQSDGTYLAAGLDMPTWIEGPIPAEIAGIGLVDGWNVLHFGEDGAEPELGDPLAINLPVNLSPRLSISVSGTSVAPPGEDAGLVLAPAQIFDGGFVDSYLFDEPLSDSWEIAVSGEPPEDHLVDDADLPPGSAYELPVAYRDADGVPGFTSGDTPVSLACADSTVAALLWIGPPMEPAFALYMASAELAPGWVALGIPGGDAPPEFRDEEAANSLVIGSDGCGF